MTVTAFPGPYQSVFRDACFTLAGIQTSYVDVSIRAVGETAPIGVKRIYTEAGEWSVNVAPYVRRLISPEPMCGLSAGICEGARRVVSCFVEAPGCTSAAVALTGGTRDVPPNTILSAAPRTVKIRPGEKDEISVITGGIAVKPVIVFNHLGVEYIDDSHVAFTGSGMATMVVDADYCGRIFASLTGTAGVEMTGFTVRLKVGEGTQSETTLERRYILDRISGGGGGRRLAWVNRYGAIDYHTFPTVGEVRSSGRRTRIYTPDGYRTVATAAERSETLLSEPCDAGAADWLAGIFSSPAVWEVDGPQYEKIEVEGGGIEYSPLRPAVVSVNISDSLKTVSRKF